MGKISLKKEPLLDAKYNAFFYQKEAFEAVKNLEYAAIFHEQGLGKTKIAIDLMLYWLEKKLVDTVLFVAKRGLVANWEKEFNNHTHIKPKVLTQNRRKNFYIYNSPCRVILTHFEVLKSDYDRIKLFLKARDVAIIIDESAKIKNPESELTKVYLGLSKLFKKRVIMTGTPVANRPHDIWSQIRFLDDGYSLGREFSVFKKSVDLNNRLSDDLVARNIFEENISSIFQRISHFSVREVKDSGIIDLPEKKIETIYCEWEKSQYDLYSQIRDETRAVIVKNGMPQEDVSDDILKRLLRLVQVASNPRLVDSSYYRIPGKYENLEDIINKIINQNEKAIIWSCFTDNVDWLCKELSYLGTCKVHGKMPIERRNRSIEGFLEEESTKIMVATPGAAKEGLTLTVANHVIFYDRGFSPDDYLQAQDRIHRISQTKTCYVYNLIMQNSIDEWVDCLLYSKQYAAKLSQGDITLSEFQEKMTYDFGSVLHRILGD